jgi:hypothetical protein
MPKRSLDDVMERLIGALLTSNTPLSTREIARRAGVDWRTARKFLNILSGFSKVGTLTSTRKGPVVVWKLENTGIDARARITRETPINLRRFTEWTEAVLSFREAVEKGEKVGLARE